MNQQATYTEQEINSMIDSLVEKIIESKKEYKCVVGIREGGLNVSIPIARELGLPHHSVHISFYEPEYGEAKGLVSDDGFVWQEDCLLVDDLIDYGHTIDCFKSNFGEADVAVLFWSLHYPHEPEYYVQIKPPFAWVVFPWEKEDEC